MPAVQTLRSLPTKEEALFAVYRLWGELNIRMLVAMSGYKIVSQPKEVGNNGIVREEFGRCKRV